MEKEEYWKKHSEAQRVSGQSMEEYCQSHELNFNSLQYWRAKLSGKRGGEGAKGSRFVQVKVAGSQPVDSGVVARLLFGEGLVLECMSWPEAKWIREVRS